MALTLSQRLGLTLWGAGTDPYNRAQRQAAHEALDSLVAIDKQGLAVDQPAATAATRGTYWTSTDGPDAGVTFRSDGAVWRRVNGTRVTRIPHTFTIDQQLYVPAADAFYVSPFPVPVPAGQTATLVALSARLRFGTSVTWQLRRTPKAGGAGELIVGPTTTNNTGTGAAQRITTSTVGLATVALPIALADEDDLALEVTAVTGSPKNLRVAALIDYRS